VNLGTHGTGWHFVSKARVLNHNEFGSVFYSPGRSQRWIPEFAANEGQLKSVLVHAAVSYIFRSKKVPEDIATDLEYLKRLANDRHAQEVALHDGSGNEHWNRMSEHLRAVGNAGGYLQLTAGISYRAWRLGWHNKEIGDVMGMKGIAVNGVIVKLLRIAETLGYPTRPRRRDKPKHVRGVDDILLMWDEGETVSYTHLTLPTICSV